MHFLHSRHSFWFILSKIFQEYQHIISLDPDQAWHKTSLQFRNSILVVSKYTEVYTLTHFILMDFPCMSV